MSKVEENQEIMRYLALQYGDVYFEMFGTLVMEGHSIQNAIDICYANLYVIKK